MAADTKTSFDLKKWFKDRYDFGPFLDLAKHKIVPIHHHTIWYYFGGITLFLFLVQVLTGILLLLYYRPGADSAFESVQFIITQVKFGWLIRSLHSWSANLMVLAAFIHMFSNFFVQSYRKPREFTWLSGMLLFGLTLGFGFSGYLLPWNELAFFATKVGTDIIGVVPVVGKPLLIFLRGSEDVTGATLNRFFGFHVALLPLTFLGFLTIHLLFVQDQGMAEPISYSKLPKEKQRSMAFFPNFVLRDLIGWLFVLIILTLLALFFPWELGKKADLFASAPAGIKPEWYFMFMFQTLKLLPSTLFFIEGELLGILGFGLGALLWALVPFFDKRGSENRSNPFLRIIGVAIVLYILAMTVAGYVL
ncbi:MAG: cytochrome bc complex cytochrome b subunit [bacterium]|nr:cytochrome bc complex cytochrome b subunit [bacterium]